MFQLNQNKQKTNPNSLKESIFGYFKKKNLGLFWFLSVCYETVLFVSVVSIFSRFETPKQTKKFCFWFHETNRNTTETNLV
jgi:hypothetical protein